MKVIISDEGTEFTKSCTSSLRGYGYEVTVVQRDGSEVLNFVERISPDVLVIDSFLSRVDAL